MKYVKPMLSVETFEMEDIITTSLVVGEDTTGTGGEISFGDLK